MPQAALDGTAVASEWNADVAWQARARYRPLAWFGLLASVVAMVLLPQAVGSGYLIIPGCMYALRELYFGRPRAPGRSRMHRAMVSVDADAVRVVGPALTRRWPRSEVRSGWVDSFGGLHTAVIGLANGDWLWVGAPTPADAHALVRSLGLAGDQQTYVAPLARKPKLVGGMLLILLAASLGNVARMFQTEQRPYLPLTLLAVLVMLLGGIQLVGLVPPRVVVGTDGVRIIEGRRERFVSYAQVTAIDCAREGVWLRRAEGDVLLCTFAGRAGTWPSQPSAHTVALYHRVREARAAGMGGNVAPAKLALLERKGHDIGTWVERMRALPRQGDYRQAALESDDLLRVLLDGRSSTERRVAAAAALSARDEPGMRERVRIAGAASANPRLRVAIDAVTKEQLDEEALAEALAEEEKAQATRA